MSELPGSDAVEVFSGTAAADLRWVVLVEGDDQDLFTMLDVYRGIRRVARSGFGGPKLHSGSVLNAWRVRTNDLPFFVYGRTSPIVDRVVATTDRGSQVVLAMSRRIEPVGLRFAAAALPDGERPGKIWAERGGVVLETQPIPRPHPPRSPSTAARTPSA